MSRRLIVCLAVAGVCLVEGAADVRAAATLTPTKAKAALRQAVCFFQTKVSASGGYLWRYSADLSLQEGERTGSATTAWVQPPGTPTVGDALLEAYHLTGEKLYLEAARQTASALVAGQLQSGGWDYRIEFDPKDRRRYAYRSDGRRTGRNMTTLDDDTTQSAIRFLMRVDQTLKFKDREIHDAVEFALESLLRAQYPNGAWPQRYSRFLDPGQFPVKRAAYPDSWSRTYPQQDYRGHYTFNDDTIADLIDMMFLAAEFYNDDRYRTAGERGGDFMLLAQMPEPQPGWAQQYDLDMRPAWARKFEPPAVSGGESQGVMRTLLNLYRRTGKKKYLEPIPRALTYYRKSLLPDGRLARFYELKTNRPLYFVKDTYELTYSSDNMPTHYGFIVGSKLDSIEAESRQLLRTGPAKLNPPHKTPVYLMSRQLASRAQAVVDALDERGAWVEEGRLRTAGTVDRIIDCRTFVNNVGILSRFIAASQ